jgi:putative ABC transport system permease protein
MGLTRLALRELAAHWGRNILTVVGIGLGVVLIVAVSRVSRSTSVAFSEMLDTVAGQAVLEVSAGDAGLPEDVIDLVRDHPGVKHAAPLVLGSVFLDDDSGVALALVGVDVTEEREVRSYKAEIVDGESSVDPLEFLNSRESVLLTQAFVRQRGMKVGDTLEVLTPAGRQRLTLRAALRPEGIARAIGDGLAVMDIFAGQLVVGKKGKVDRISITLKEGFDVDDVARSLAKELPPGVKVERPEQRGAALESLLASFEYTLSAISLLALLVGLCVVYNTFCTSVARRQREFGVLRALGSRRRDLRRLILSEAALLGLAGSIVGWTVGLWTSRLLIGAVAQSAEAQTAVSLGVPALASPTWSDAAKAFGGVAAALIGAWVPARQASSVSVLEALRPELFERLGAERRWRSAAIGLVLFLGASGLIALGVVWQAAALIGGATLLLVVAFLLGAVWAAAIAVERSQNVLGRILGVRGAIAVSGIARRPERTAFTVAVLAIGVLLHVFIVTLHNSVRSDFLNEQSHTTQADLVVFPTVVTGGRVTAPVDGSVADALRAVDGVQDVAADRDAHQAFAGTQIYIQAFDDAYFRNSRYGRWPFVDGDVERAMQAVRERGAVLVSQNFAFHFGVGVGDRIALDTPGGEVSFPVAGVVVESFDAVGTVIMSRRTYAEAWRDPLVSWFYVLLAPGADRNAVKQGILHAVHGAHRLRILETKEFLAYVEENVDEAFRFTGVLEGLVLAVVLLSLADTLLVGVLARTREIGVLRAVGARRRDVIAMVVLEGMVISALGYAAGIAGGIALSVLWMKVHFKYLFGWIMLVDFPPLAVVTIFGLIACMTLLAAAYPAFYAGRLTVTRAVAHE